MARPRAELRESRGIFNQTRKIKLLFHPCTTLSELVIQALLFKLTYFSPL